MKKKMIIPAIVVVVLLLVLFLPIPLGSYDDGGTRTYWALTYEIVKWNRISIIVDEEGQFVNNTYQKTSVFWYPDNQKSIDELWQMELENK